MAKELGPVLTGLMLAGRVGAAMAAELGTMKVTEQIDALESLATDPYGFLIFPRLLACLVLTPILVIFADFIGIFGGYLLTVNVFQVPAHFYMLHSREYLDTWGLVSGSLKGIVFGGLICILSCHKGFTASKGAEGVGKATTEAVVVSSIMILIANFFLTLLMY
jgi:phospholipid/cholesterol/gamma-HCH transport system permease protein